MRKFLIFCFAIVLTACQPSVQDSSTIQLEEVATALLDNGLKIKEEEELRKSVFSKKLVNVVPTRYTLENRDLYIFVFDSEEDRKKGEKEFENKTATMDLVSFQSYVQRNILIFYVHAEDLNSVHIPYITDIQVALDSIEEG